MVRSLNNHTCFIQANRDMFLNSPSLTNNLKQHLYLYRRWHAVLNLTNTVGITQNFCSSRNFDEVWMQTRSGRKRLAWKWLCQLEQRYPRLAERAKALNARDKFFMKYDPAVQRMRQEAMERLKQKRYLSKHHGGGEEEKKEANDDTVSPPLASDVGSAKPLINGMAKPPFIPTSLHFSYLDREWKRIPVTDQSQTEPSGGEENSSVTQSRPVSPP